MHEDLDASVEIYSRNRPHRGRGMDGRTPYQVFKKGIRKPRTPKEVNEEGGEDRSLQH